MTPQIDNTPYTGPKQSQFKGKYTHLFDDLKPGQCIKTDPKTIKNVAKALTRWLAKNDTTGNYYVRQTELCDDGFGRVWLLKKTAEGKK